MTTLVLSQWTTVKPVLAASAEIGGKPNLERVSANVAFNFQVLVNKKGDINDNS